MRGWYSIISDKQVDLLRDLATGARLHRAEPFEGRLDLEQNGERRPSPYTSGDYSFLLELGFVEGLAENREPFYPVAITAKGRDYVAGGYWLRGYRPGKLDDGRWAVSTPTGQKDLSSAVRGRERIPSEIARIVMLNIGRLAQQG
ncbi:hypothetical protein F1643_21015 [Azospirillum sp. INR13]|uniref:hypothetical protein n=1 Tax=Azospirillum sp. INR13 TaxID=2596919 RepID=UPI001892521C|nr:hypothetical protein [Azospirillum sp. INR13]MBF5096481.1 hypothetical protein [Azospirillum sp. INR13]